MDSLFDAGILYILLQLGVAGAFGITSLRAWRRSRARFIELVSAFAFGLLLEQGDIFLFGTYRYNAHWFHLGDVPVAIALTWALIIAGAMNMTDVLGLAAFRTPPYPLTSRKTGVVKSVIRGLPAPIADAVWAILLDLALDAVAIRLGLWMWTIRADEGWFGVPWGNFFAWLFVAFWFSFFTRIARAQALENPRRGISQWSVPFLAFGGLIATLVPFVAIENTAALPFVPDEGGRYQNGVWIVFGITLALFVAVTVWALAQKRLPRERADHWLLFVRLVIHVLFLVALVGAGIYWNAPLLLVAALAMLALELVLTRVWLAELGIRVLDAWRHSFTGARAK